MIATWLQVIATRATDLRAAPIITGDLNVRQVTGGGIEGTLRELAKRGIPGQGSRREPCKGDASGGKP